MFDAVICCKAGCVKGVPYVGKFWSGKKWEIWQIECRLPIFISQLLLLAISCRLYRQLIHQYFIPPKFSHIQCCVYTNAIFRFKHNLIITLLFMWLAYSFRNTLQLLVNLS